MAKIIVNNPRQVINGGAKKYYFKVKGLGGPKGDKGDKGDTGATGPEGPQGNAATVSVGSTTTLPVGQDATVQNVGTLYNAVLNFGIPQGPRGPQGATGATGAKGDKGDQGNPGPQGEKGTNATVTVGTTTTTEPGTQAYAWNSSSNPNNAVINFNIPRGATGSQGPQGIQGPIGPAGADGESFTPVVVSSLPTTGDEGKLYLTPKDYTTGTGTGNPITATITDEAGKIESFQLDGDTYQQTYTGKNLFNKANVVNGIPSASDGSITSTSSIGRTSDYIPVMPNTAYSHTGHPLGWATIAWYKSDKSFIERTDNATTTTSPNEAAYARVSCAQGDLDTCQFEIGQPTAYEPYVGGQASPNPDYPQQIQAVTGTQTISVNGTDYPLDLGTIELCKLGAYQDYIYKDGEDWKVHNTIRKTIVNGGETWEAALSSLWGSNAYACSSIGGFKPWSPTKSDRFIDAELPQAANIQSGYMQMAGFSWVIRIVGVASVAELKTWLSSNNVTLHYVLATATDTVITDTTLIAQLEAIRTASLENGTNTITNTATGTNLAGDMEIGYFEFNPTNRYDKFIWLNLNNNYEQIGGE